MAARYPDPDPEAEAFLAPVKPELEKLRRSVAPPPHMRRHFPTSKTHVQIVRERLEPVGAFIVREVGKMDSRAREMELRVW